MKPKGNHEIQTFFNVMKKVQSNIFFINVMKIVQGNIFFLNQCYTACFWGKMFYSVKCCFWSIKDYVVFCAFYALQNTNILTEGSERLKLSGHRQREHKISMVIYEIHVCS